MSNWEGCLRTPHVEIFATSSTINVSFVDPGVFRALTPIIKRQRYEIKRNSMFAVGKAKPTSLNVQLYLEVSLP